MNIQYVRLDDSVSDILNRMAREQRRTVSEVVNEMLRRQLDESSPVPPVRNASSG